MLTFIIFTFFMTVPVILANPSAHLRSWGPHRRWRSNEQTGNCPDSCLEPMNEGFSPCSMENSDRWFYNTEKENCDTFQYSGCGVVPNNFETESDCTSKCRHCSHQNITARFSGHQPWCHCFYVQHVEYTGCRIQLPPPEGYKCRCTESRRNFCDGEAIPCNSEEYCPGQCSNRKCCITAKGECNGYPRRPEGADSTTKSLEVSLETLRGCLAENGVLDLMIDQDKNPVRYDILNHQWNKRIKKIFPLAYFLPKSTANVQSAVKCGVKTNVHVIPNSGAHSYEAISYGSNETMVIDFREMKGVSLNAEQRTATLQPGNLVGPITAHLWMKGRFGVPLGNCMTVGIGGHAIGGGIGYFSTTYGLTVDNVLEYTMVDAEGKVRVVNQNRNADLWWALRGIGDGYLGIITKVKLKMFQANKASLTYIKLRWEVKHYIKVMTAFQNWLTWVGENEPTVSTVMYITSDRFPLDNKFPPVHPGITIELLYIEDMDIQPESNTVFLQGYPNIFPVDDAAISVTNPSYLEFVALTGYAPVNFRQRSYSGKIHQIGRVDDPIIPILLGIKDFKNPDEWTLQYLLSLQKEIAAPRYFKAKSFFVKKNFESANLARVNEVLQNIPNHSIWLKYSAQGGAITNITSTGSAYVHRVELYDLTVHHEGSSEPHKVAEASEWMKEFWNAIQFMDGGQTYQSYPDLDSEDFLNRHYAENLQRLINMKQIHDPNNYFRNQLSIP